MAGIIQKALRGAATAGAQLSMEQHRANILAKRDERLREYKTSERVAGQEFKASQADLAHKRELEKGSMKGSTQADVQFMNHLVKSGVAKDDDDAFKKLKELRIKNDPQERMMELAKMLQENDPQHKRKPVKEYFKDAQTLSEKFFEQESGVDPGLGYSGAGGGTGSDGSAPPVPGAEQASDGNWYVKQDGKWFRVDQ